MNSKTQAVLLPVYMHKFSCIGPECEDSCCIGWQININREIYDSLKKIKQPELKSQIVSGVKRNFTNNKPSDYARLVMKSNGECPFLTGGLCKIHLKLGEQFLPDTCFMYPRVYNLINGVLEKSALVSCPQAARLILLNPSGIEFDQIEENIAERKLITQRAVTSKAEQFLWELRFFAIELLQNRDYSIADRLIILGTFCIEVQQSLDKENAEIIPEIISSFRHSALTGELKEELEEIKTYYRIQVEFLEILIGTLAKKGRYGEYYQRFSEGLGLNSEKFIEAAAERYQEALQNYYQPFMFENGYILENYLVNYLFSNTFPCGIYPSVYDEFIMLIVHYALIKFQLVGLAGYYKALSPEVALNLIQSFARHFEHNKNHLKEILSLLHRVGYTKMADLMIIIKD